MNKFIKSTLILIIGGFITKMLGFIIKILYTRQVGTDGISLYSLIIPSYSLIITIATLALPVAISKLIAEEKYEDKKILSSAFFLIFVVDIFVIVLILFSKNFICNNLLKEPRINTLFISIAITIPFISFSSVLKGYFFGKQNMIPNTVSNIAEQILRIILIIVFLPLLLEKSLIWAISGLILLSVFSECLSILIFYLFLPKAKKRIVKPDSQICKSILQTAIPSVSSRIIGNIGFFFEPIILTNILLFKGFSSNYILKEYGVYNAYAIATLTLPSFFIMALSSALIPEISKYYAQKKFEKVKRRFFQALTISFAIGGFCSLFILGFRENILQILYHTKTGSEYIKLLAPFFVLFYLEGPLNSTLQAINEAKITLKVSTIGVIIKLVSMSTFAFLKKGLLSLVYAEIINIIFVVIMLFSVVNKKLILHRYV